MENSRNIRPAEGSEPCPVCGQPASYRAVDTAIDADSIFCPTCTNLKTPFMIIGSPRLILCDKAHLKSEQKQLLPSLSAYLRQMSSRGEIVVLSEDNWEVLARSYQISAEEVAVEDVVEEDEVPIEYDIATYPSDFTLSGIHTMWYDGDIEIPEFQREFVWTIKQASLLMESFLLGLPVPPVFFYIDEEHKNLVIDGQQRILSAVYYFDGYFGEESLQGRRQVFRLMGLDERSPYHNRRFEDLQHVDQRKLQTAVLRAINIRQLSPKDNNTSIYHIFERLNTGGTALKAQEIRNCVFRGQFAKTLGDLNLDKNWRLIMGKETKDRHQKDVELVLRVFALSQGWEKYEKPMKEYLNVTMRQHQRGDSKAVQRFVDVFPKVSALIVEHLGAKPFHKYGPLNASILDAVFCTLLANYSRIPANLKERFLKLLNDKEFFIPTLGRTTDTPEVQRRFKAARKHLIE